MERRVPALRWLLNYDRKDLRGDVSAGLTVAVLLVPQAMAYAMLAGLPPLVGLYASTIPLLVYALLGTSRQMAVGPAAMVSLLVLSSVSRVAEPGSEAFVGHAITLALLVGALQLAMGALRLGFVVRLLAHPVISGFTSAVALIIAVNQLGQLLGLGSTRSQNIGTIVVQALTNLGRSHFPTMTIAGLSLLALIALRRFRPRFPAALAVVTLGALATWMFDLANSGVAIVGAVPAGLPIPSLPQLSVDALGLLLPSAVIIASIGFVESIAVAKVTARRHGYDVNANRELVALGSANVAASLFGAYPVMGGFARTAVNDRAGARTQLAAIVTASAVALTLAFLTPLFHYLPSAVLSAIIVAFVVPLIDIAELRRLLRVRKSDAVLMLATFGATLVFGVELGMLIGVALSLAFFVARTTRPHTAVLGELDGHPGVYRNVKRFPEARTTEGILIVRIDASFYFANMDFLGNHLEALERLTPVPLHTVIIDASSINDLDSSAASALAEIADGYAARGIRLCFAAVKGPVRDMMARVGLRERLGPDAFTHTIQEAVERVRAESRPRSELIDFGSVDGPAFRPSARVANERRIEVKREIVT